MINNDTSINTTKIKREKIAYITFKILGYLSLLLAFGATLLAFGIEPGVVGFSIFLPTTLILFPVLILGTWLSLIVWHDRHLNIIKTLTLVIAIALFLFQHFDWLILLLLILYGIACISIDTEIMKNFTHRIDAFKK